MTKKSCTLQVNALKLNVHLGWPEKERLKKQIVWLDLYITFPNVPKACQTDRLENTYCYADIIKILSKQISNKTFHLIEHLTAEIYKMVKNLLPKNVLLSVCITKYPKIKQLQGGVSFHYGDQL